MKRIALHARARTIPAYVCAEHFTEDSFKQNKEVRSFVGTLFQASSACTQASKIGTRLMVRVLTKYGKWSSPFPGPLPKPGQRSWERGWVSGAYIK